MQEDVRVQTGYSSVPASSSFSYSATSSNAFHPNIMMGLGEMETTEIRYGDSQSTARWNNNNGILESMQPRVTRHQHVEVGFVAKEKKERPVRFNGLGQSELRIKRHTGTRFRAQIIALIRDIVHFK
ncbi:hypothetical protein HHK36_021646 [Tetracentron sinense]|uniref:Uncharacterized protein n=1 Tax=Tetracentron sinense TaxID=13715 RepID=A0A834YRZ0_TETSI|nr:hypothetical protein HHK36_021646 [Tetracentron sinense]